MIVSKISTLLRRGVFHAAFCSFALGVAVVGLAGPVSAQDNSIYVTQDSSGATRGNRLFVDQSASANTLVTGSGEAEPLGPVVSTATIRNFVSELAPDPTSAARQSGAGNEGSIVIEADNAEVAFLQDNPGVGAGNSGEVMIEQGALGAMASLTQLGSGNEGAISLSGLEASGTLYQNGNDNRGSVTVNGAQASGTLIQNGNGNAYDLQVAGLRGSNVIWEQSGNNLTGPDAANVPAQVFSNGGTVIIRQTRLGAD